MHPVVYNHKRNEEQPFICSVREKSFAQKQQFLAHISEHKRKGAICLQSLWEGI